MRSQVFTGISFFVISASLLAIATACGNGGTEEETNVNDTLSADTSTAEQRMNTQNVFYNIPSPGETSALLLDVGAEYDFAYVNDPTIFKQYLTEESRAINTGVYGADLSFAGVFENSQEAMSFLKCVNGLCKDLGIAGVFDEKTAARLEKNKDNRDSLLDIVSKSFWQADAFLKKNQRPNTSSLIVAGGWVEGMFIASKVYEKTKNVKLIQRIVSAPQRSSLNSLVALLQSSKQNERSKFLSDGLAELQAIYAKIPAGNTSADTTKASVTPAPDNAIFNEIVSKITAIRTQMVSQK